MYLKSLEIHGFKSFPDKIKLDFDKGITAVVGPNGSGKSNIGDAVRWVLGEQSSRTLRGAKMEDIIFAGTQMRRPMGFASVTLTIVNNGELNIPAEEVAVTRKLYRSGESEYMINGSQVRLKDISELFMDTGLGRDGYSIIGQGKAAEIISSKSSERRNIFEEAAGISHSKYRKEDAQNKLQKAEENIVRLEDILRELEERVGPLKVQSEKAEKFVVLAERRKALEVTVWLSRIDEAGERVSGIEEKLLINEAEYNNANLDIKKNEEKEEELSKDINLSNIAIERIQTEISDRRREAAEESSRAAVLENEIKHYGEDLEELEQKIAEAEAAGNDSSKLTEKKDAELESTCAEIKAKEKSIEELKEKLLSADEDAGELDRKRGEQEKALSALYIKRTELDTSVASARKSLEDSGREGEEEQRRKTELEEELSKLEKEKEQIEKGLAAVEEKLSENRNKLAGTRMIYESKSKKFSAMNEEQNRILSDIRVKKEREQILTDLENAMEGYSGASKAILTASKNGQLKGICGTVSQILTIESEYTAAIETALGGALQNIITENEDVAKRGIRLLKDRNAGRATFLPLTSVHGTKLDTRFVQSAPGFIGVASDLVEYDDRYDGVVKSLLGRVAVAENIDYAGNIARSAGYKFRIVTLDGQVVNAGGSYTGGSLNRSSGILSRKNEIDKIRAERAALEKKAEERKGLLVLAKDECERLSLNISAIEEENSVLLADKARFEAERKRAEDLNIQVKSAAENMEKTALRMKIRDEELRKTITESEAELEKVNRSIEESEERSSEGSEYREKLRVERERLSEELSQAKISLAQLEMTKENIIREKEDIKRRALEMGDMAVKYAEETEKIKEKAEEARQQAEKIREGLRAGDDKANMLMSEITRLKSENSLKEKEISGLRSLLREAQSHREGIASERTRLEERKTALQAEQDRVISQMQEQYELYPSQAREMAIEFEDIKELEDELGSVRNRIRALGNVNLAAIEEYKEVSGRYEELKGRLRDVTDSKKELERLIDELTVSMEKKFRQSFNDINTAFKSIFTELFGGGRAELSLSDPENVLTSGIEIKAAPPGKVIGNLSLMSGGEQAFVAIAIYFAILKVRPAPFCILDEIEAALDDVNVSRYAQYLHRYTDTTQFITITHRRGTMEEADVFYGVTMQEKGISRLLRMEQADTENTEMVVSD